MVTCEIDGQFSPAVLCAADSQSPYSLTMFKTADELISAVFMLYICGSFENRHCRCSCDSSALQA